MAELHAIWISAVFAADTELDVWTSLSALCDGHFHQLANAGLINGRKRVLLDDFQFLIGTEEGAGVIAAHAQRGLCEVIGSEAEEFRRLSNVVRGECPARHFDHGANEIVQLELLLFHDVRGDAMDDLDLEVEFLLEADEGNHDFGMHFDSLLLNFRSGFEHSAGLHFGNFRIDDPETAAAETKHRVEFM